MNLSFRVRETPPLGADNLVIAIARNDDASFGILESRDHQA
jgi:hypothetical protein